jgi:hypothetical protein
MSNATGPLGRVTQRIPIGINLFMTYVFFTPNGYVRCYTERLKPVVRLRVTESPWTGRSIEPHPWSKRATLRKPEELTIWKHEHVLPWQ